MNTECTPNQLDFHGLGRRAVVAKFDGGQISSDGGGLLLREVERRTGILRQLAEQFTDYRDTDGQYDAVVSIEMLEAVGKEHWPDYFRVLNERLRPGAAAVVREPEEAAGQSSQGLPSRQRSPSCPSGDSHRPRDPLPP